MLLGLLYTVLKVLGVLLLLLVAAMAYMHFKAQATIARFQQQGMESMQGNGIFFVGAAARFADFVNATKANPNEVIPHPARWFLD